MFYFAPLVLIWVSNDVKELYISPIIPPTPFASLGNIFNSSTATTLGLNSTGLVDVNTSTEISNYDIATSIVPTKIGKVQTLQFWLDFCMPHLKKYYIMYVDILYFKIMDLSLLMSEAVARQFVNDMYWGQRVLQFLERNHLMSWNLY